MESTMSVVKFLLLLASTTAIVECFSVPLPLLPDCSAVLCFSVLPDCPAGQKAMVPEGECCPKCVPDCSLVRCALPICRSGQKAIVPEGECCPICVPDINCAATSCVLSDCPVGQKSMVPDGECCPICVPDCSAVLCLLPDCPIGQKAMVPEGECCPKCVPDCSLVRCGFPICPLGQKAIIPEGECCPKCVPDCSAVSCLKPVCLAGQVLKVPEGECCPKCVCSIKGQEFSDCASACPRTCESPDIACRAACRPGCQCPRGLVIDTANQECVQPDECPEPCPIPGQVRSNCAPPPGCETTCVQIINEERRFCPAVCQVGGCTCPAGLVLDTMNGECSSEDECPNPCETVNCTNGRCKISEPTFETFCEPSCSINNGGCAEDEVCSLQVVQCVRAPCPPIVKCMDPCDECLPSQICTVKVAPCLISPCPVFAECTEIDPCETIRCRNGFRCEVEDGVGFCMPDCSLNNGGCLANQTCELKEVVCVTSPCPPERICKDNCPPTCTNAFCRKWRNRKAPCSNPGPRGIPGCTGSCNLSYCSAGYCNDEFLPLPPNNCQECSLAEYSSPSRCYKKWAKCIRWAHFREHGYQYRCSEDDYKHYTPFCGLKG